MYCDVDNRKIDESRGKDMENRSVVTRKTQIRPVKTQNGQVSRGENAGEKPAKTAIKRGFC